MAKCQFKFGAMAAALLVGLLAAPAGAATIAVTAGSGTNLLTHQDGSGNNAMSQVICDSTTPTTCATVSAGAVSVSAASLPLPSGAATAAGQAAVPTSVYTVVSGATTNCANIKGSAGTITKIVAFNTNANPRYVKLFDKATAPVAGTDTPYGQVGLVGNATGGGSNVNGQDQATTSGIGVCITGGITLTDSTAISANDVALTIYYK